MSRSPVLLTLTHFITLRMLSIWFQQTTFCRRPICASEFQIQGLTTMMLKRDVPWLRYQPIRTPARKLMGTPTPYGGTPLYHIPEETRDQQFDVPKELEGLPELKPEDQQYFGKLLKEVTLLVCCHCLP